MRLNALSVKIRLTRSYHAYFYRRPIPSPHSPFKRRRLPELDEYPPSTHIREGGLFRVHSEGSWRELIATSSPSGEYSRTKDQRFIKKLLADLPFP